MDTRVQQDLEAIRDHLASRSAELHERLRRVRLDLARETNPLPRDSPDAAIALENDEILEAIETSALQELGHIERALARIEAGKFGTCESCGADIDRARLKAVAYATRCRSCAGDG